MQFVLRAPLRAVFSCVCLFAVAPCLRAAAPPSGEHALRTTPIEHVQRTPLDARDRAPLPAPEVRRELAHSDYDRPLDLGARLTTLRKARTNATAASCDTSVFTSAHSSALISAIKAVDATCLNQLYSITGTPAAQTFAEANMVTVANALHSDAPAYAGNDSGHMLELITFLRAGYYVQYYDSSDVGSYGSALSLAIRPALDAFVANAHFDDVSDAHGAVLSEFVTLIDSAGENAHQLGTLKDLLNRYGTSWQASYDMVGAANNVFSVLYRGHDKDDFRAAVQADPSITDALAAFVANRAADVGGGYEYLVANAARELARFLQYPDPLLSALEPKVKTVIDAYPLSGTGASIHVAAADGAYTYDLPHCAYFGLCNFPQDLATAVLVVTHQCSPTLRLRAQSLTAQQVLDTCALVGAEEGYFQRKLQTNNTPVANDHNTALEMVVFASSSDYQTYSGVIFGNNTNNGGIYLEGDPSSATNQPRFLCYVAEWLTPFQIWNLTHEYIHYNDGRFDMYGSFGDYPLDLPGSSVWYIEGLAEYLSYSFREIRYPDAIAQAATHQYALSQIFDNTYDSGQVRVYNWGYLAVRFMFELHRNQVTTMLGYFRPGNYAGYRSWLAGMRTSHDAEWTTWLACIAAHDGDTTTCGGSGNSETGVFGDGFDGDEPPLPKECTAANASELGDNCTRSHVASSGNNPAYFSLLLPAGLQSVEIDTSGGSGNGDLYVRAGAWPSLSTFDVDSTGPDNAEHVSIAQPPAGWLYIMLAPTQAFSEVQVLARFHR